jgi:hypothetical protein
MKATHPLLQPGLVLSLVLSLLLAGCVSHTGWAQLFPTSSPPALGQAGAVYDLQSGQGVVFGGITKTTWSDETWIWDGNTWHSAAPAARPPAREKLALAYDEDRDRVVLFGGRSDAGAMDDTWEWDGKNWQQFTPARHPAARCCHAMAYDEVNHTTLLSGGWDEKTNTFFSDTWAWDGQDWRELLQSGLPANAAHTLVTVPPDQKIISIPSTKGAVTLEWAGKSWSAVQASPEPSRADGRSVYDSGNRRVVLFGGIAGGVTYLDDTWLFAAHTWVQVKLTPSPAARYAPVMFYDLKRQSIILFGGVGANGLLRDTWEIKLPGDVSPLMVATVTAP